MSIKRNKTKKSPKRITKKEVKESAPPASFPTIEIPEPAAKTREAERVGTPIGEPSGPEAPAPESPADVSSRENPPLLSDQGESAGPEEKEESLSEEDELELLTFSLAKEEYAIDIMVIQEITKLTEITAIPRTPPYIHGIVTLRGNVIPVFNMHRRLKLDPFTERGKSRFVICQLKEGAVAIMVDEVIDVVHLKKSQLEPPPSGITANGGGFIKSIGRAKERLLILLDIEKALQVEPLVFG
jgi:purine-binding chemotaxis protein CheW